MPMCSKGGGWNCRICAERERNSYSYRLEANMPDPELERLLREEEEIERRTQQPFIPAPPLRTSDTRRLSGTRSVVFNALENARNNGFHCSDPMTEARDLVRYDKDLEDFKPEDLEPFVAEWLAIGR